MRLAKIRESTRQLSGLSVRQLIRQLQAIPKEYLDCEVRHDWADYYALVCGVTVIDSIESDGCFEPDYVLLLNDREISK